MKEKGGRRGKDECVGSASSFIKAIMPVPKYLSFGAISDGGGYDIHCRLDKSDTPGILTFIAQKYHQSSCGDVHKVARDEEYRLGRCIRQMVGLRLKIEGFI